MLKVMTAFTVELDNSEKAVREILEQIDINNLSTSTFGMISCGSEFIEAGIVKAISSALPFDVIGCTTIACSVNGNCGENALTLSVITGNGIKLSGIMSNSLAGDYDSAIKKAYEEALFTLGEKPVMCFAYVPLVFNLGGDRILASFDRHSGGIPIFGTIAVDHNSDYKTAQTFFNGNASFDCCAMMFVAGDISPKFRVASIPDIKIQKQKAIITKSLDNILIEVNNMPIAQYLGKFGIMRDNKIEGANIIPFVVDLNDGSKPMARAVFAATPEGHIVCGGSMPENATLGISAMDYEDILLTSEDKMLEINKNLGVSGVVMFSCIARYLCLGVDTTAEMEKVSHILGNKRPFQLTYSGGEICPVYTTSGRIVNRFHNYSLAICIF